MAVRKSQQGVALVAVLLIFALISVLAASMVHRQNLLLQRSLNMLSQDQAYQFALAIELFAREVLHDDYEKDRKDNKFVDTLQELENSIVYAEPTFSVEGQLDDLQARFNINSLVTPTGQVNSIARQRFENLLFQLGITDFRVEVLIDWLDPDDQVSEGGGAEDETYLLKDPPYRAGNQPMRNTSELLLLEGMTRETYELLEPYVTALPPEVNKLNVNTMSAQLIRSLDSRISEQQALAAVEARGVEGYESLQEFLNEFASFNLQSQAAQLDVRSEYFQLTARAIFDGRSSRLVSIIHRDRNGEIEVIQRDQGKRYAITKQALQLQ